MLIWPILIYALVSNNTDDHLIYANRPVSKPILSPFISLSLSLFFIYLILSKIRSNDDRSLFECNQHFLLSLSHKARRRRRRRASMDAIKCSSTFLPLTNPNTLFSNHTFPKFPAPNFNRRAAQPLSISAKDTRTTEPENVAVVEKPPLSKRFLVSDGLPSPFGATVRDDGVNFSVYSSNSVSATICLISLSDLRQVSRFPHARVCVVSKFDVNRNLILIAEQSDGGDWARSIDQ